MTTLPEASWFVYVLLNDGGIAYTGIAKGVVARLAKHNAGTGARFTRGRGPWRLVHVEGPMTHGDALRREIAIKRDAAFKFRLKNTGGAPSTETLVLPVSRIPPRTPPRIPPHRLKYDPTRRR